MRSTGHGSRATRSAPAKKHAPGVQRGRDGRVLKLRTRADALEDVDAPRGVPTRGGVKQPRGRFSASSGLIACPSDRALPFPGCAGATATRAERGTSYRGRWPSGSTSPCRSPIAASSASTSRPHRRCWRRRGRSGPPHGGLRWGLIPEWANDTKLVSDDQRACRDAARAPGLPGPRSAREAPLPGRGGRLVRVAEARGPEAAAPAGALLARRRQPFCFAGLWTERHLELHDHDVRGERPRPAHPRPHAGRADEPAGWEAWLDPALDGRGAPSCWRPPSAGSGCGPRIRS